MADSFIDLGHTYLDISGVLPVNQHKEAMQERLDAAAAADAAQPALPHSIKYGPAPINIKKAAAAQERVDADKAAVSASIAADRIKYNQVYENNIQLRPSEIRKRAEDAAKPSTPKRQRIAKPAERVPDAPPPLRDLSVEQIAELEKNITIRVLGELRKYVNINDVDPCGPRVVRITKFIENELAVHLSMAAAPRIIDMTHLD